jgi:general nucleoside transport system permease protein
MKKPMNKSVKKNFFNVFLEELSQNSFTLIILAVLSGLILGAILVILTSPAVYQSFHVSFLDGLKTIWTTVSNTYFSLFIGSFGDPSDIMNAFQSGDAKAISTAFNPFFESLVTSTPYIFTGLALALGFRAGIFNIGAEGQFYIGSIAAAWAGWAFKGLPPIIHIPLALGIAALGGAIWGFIPGWLKAKTGAHEVINTIMMNYIAFNLIYYIIGGPFRDTNVYVARTPLIQESAHLYQFFAQPNRFHIGFFIAIGVAFLVWYLLFKTTWGFEFRSVGLNPNASRYAGMNITRITIIVMSLSGALAGLAGANEVLGVSWQQIQAISTGIGFDSIALALLANNHPLGVILTALLFGFMRSGSRLMQLRAGTPIDIISIIQAFIIFFIAAPAIIRTIYRLKDPSKIQLNPSPMASGGEK